MEVKIYSTPTCPWCKKAKEFLAEKKVAYKDIDVSTNQEAAQEMIKKSGQMGVPQLEINGNMIVGFDQAAIESELGKSEDSGEKKKAA